MKRSKAKRSRNVDETSHLFVAERENLDDGDEDYDSPPPPEPSATTVAGKKKIHVWTSEEDNTLVASIANNRGKNGISWIRVVQEMIEAHPNTPWSRILCEMRWNRHLNPARNPRSSSALPVTSEVPAAPLRVLITGASGWLGQFVWRRLAADPSIELSGTYSRSAPEWAPLHLLDLGDAAQVEAVLTQTRPDLVLHLAAISSPGACEKDTQRSNLINGSELLVSALRRLAPQALLVLTSTDLVYDGEHAPYAASADALPINAYGQSKLLAERAVLLMERAVVLRLSNMVGPPCALRHVGAKFLEWLRGAMQRREYCGLRHDELRSFVYVEDVVDAIVALVRGLQGVSGAVDLGEVVGRVLNMGGPRGLSRLDLALLLAAAEGVSVCVDESKESVVDPAGEGEDRPWRVYKTSNAESVVATGIPNPRDVTMDSTDSARRLGIAFTPMEDAIPLCLHPERAEAGAKRVKLAD